MTTMTREEFVALAKPNTMMGEDRLRAVWSCLEEIRRRKVPGDITQCGVWRGGVTLATLEYLRAAGMVDKKVWVYDTFAGMRGASDVDVTVHGERGDEIAAGSTLNCEASLDEFMAVVSASPLADSRLLVVCGDVSETLVDRRPWLISFLHLDTDFYQSTADELRYLAPRVDYHGLVMVDDYGHWEGCRAAVDEWVAEIPVRVERVDDTAIIIRGVGA